MEFKQSSVFFFTGRFLIELGLQEYPTLKKILELAAPPTDPKIRGKALRYFIDNFKEKYSKDYNPHNIKIAFLPCTDPKVYATPSECFIEIFTMLTNRITLKELEPRRATFKLLKCRNVIMLL